MRVSICKGLAEWCGRNPQGPALGCWRGALRGQLRGLGARVWPHHRSGPRAVTWAPSSQAAGGAPNSESLHSASQDRGVCGVRRWGGCPEMLAAQLGGRPVGRRAVGKGDAQEGCRPRGRAGRVTRRGWAGRDPAPTARPRTLLRGVWWRGTGRWRRLRGPPWGRRRADCRRCSPRRPFSLRCYLSQAHARASRPEGSPPHPGSSKHLGAARAHPAQGPGLGPASLLAAAAWTPSSDRPRPAPEHTAPLRLCCALPPLFSCS